MFKEKNLTPAQLRHFRQEDTECKERILHALNRKSVRKLLKSGRIIEASYGYEDGIIILNAALLDSDGKRIWKGTYGSDDIEFSLDGEERVSTIVDIVIECIYDDIAVPSDDWHESRSRAFFKKLI